MVSNRFVKEKFNKRMHKRANSIQIVDEGRAKKVRKKMIGSDKRIVSNSLKDNYIESGKDSASMKKHKKDNSLTQYKKNFSNTFYSKYFVDNPKIYKGALEKKNLSLTSKMHYLLEKPKRAEMYLRDNISLPNNDHSRIPKVQENYENLFSSKKNIILHRQRKKLFQNLRMNKAQNELPFTKYSKQREIKNKYGKNKDQELRPYSAPIDGKGFMTVALGVNGKEKKLKKWKEAFNNDKKKMNSKLLILENLNLKGKLSNSKVKSTYKYNRNMRDKENRYHHKLSNAENVYRYKRKPRYSLKRSIEH
jgi:hypothetical protein